MTHIEIFKTLRGYSRTFILNASFHSEDQYTVFFGPSGSGKTLAMRCIAGLEAPDRGLIKINGKVCFDSANNINLAAKFRHVGYMPQDYALFPHLSLLQNVAYPRTNGFGLHVGRHEKKRALEIMRRFKLEGLERHLPDALSGGQKQRASLARAVNSRPDILLLDEPFSALDPLLREHSRLELLDFMRELSIPAIIISHDPDDVDRFAGLIVLFKKGHARTVGNYQEIRPKFPTAAACLRALEDGMDFPASPPPAHGS